MRGRYETKEGVWLGVNAGMLFFAAAIKFMYAYKSRERYVVMVTVRGRFMCLVPQMYRRICQI